MSKKVLRISTAKLTVWCTVLLMAVFCTIGMSFRPVYSEDEREIVMSGPRHNHWTWITTSCGSDTYHYKSSIDYAKTTVQTRGNGYVTISTTEIDNVTSPSNGNPRSVTSGSSTGSEASISWNSGLSHDDVEKAQYTDAQIAAAHKKTFTISATSADDENYYFAGWGTSTAESSINNTDNPRTITSDMGITTYTSTSSEPANYKNSNSPYTDNNYYAFFRVREPKNITLKVPSNGTISYSYKNTPTTTPTSETTITTKYDVTLAATPDDGYKFFGWYTLSGTTENYISYISPYTRAYTNDITIYAKFIPATQAVFSIKGTNNYYYDLNRAITEASSSASKTIYLAMDGRLAIGNYTIPSGISLLIPHDITNTVQATPEVVTSATALSVFRRLTLVQGANITVASGGVLCVGARIMSAGGNKASGYPTGPCGMIDMSQGGHIELNNGSTLYAWGFIKGQDMDQGNNTTGVGTITVNNGATVWEMFAVGDWRGGTACLTIYNNRNSWKFFPFQSYTVQNIEVPTTYNYGATLSNYTNVYGDGHPNGGQFSLIGKSNTLFLMSSGSLVRKWYDPTTDLVCYEMSGTTQLDALNVDVDITTVNSSEYNLPISSSMHIILASSTTISKPMLVQAGAVVEVKSGATLTCSSNVYLFDKDNWGEYCNSKYYYTMTNLTNHKDRGNGKSNEKIDDAKLIVDGSLNITGKMYTTTGGADIMGNGGGAISFNSLSSEGNVVMCTGVSDNENVAVAQANLHNEDDSYTKAIASTTFHNVNGHWFTAAAKDGKADHTYDFTYISSGAVSGSGGNNTTTDAVYSWDKTGLELRQKWFNVTADCNEGGHYWWHGQGDQSGWFYNWTLNSDWHQFMPTATAGLYSGSNNTLYTKTSCTWEELGSTDVNCLYEIGGVKKALVDGQFVALEANNNDPAYHEAEDPTKYYICFEGCNWHAADKYTEAEKAYIIEPDTFIWYSNAWMQVNFQEPFAYTIDETNVPVYYEYVDGEWVLAEPYIRVVDGLEDRSFWFLADAFTFANSALRTSPTITILRDISGITTAVSYTGANKTCTLDLNGHSITGSVSSMITVNAAGCTFNIEDNTTEKLGKINLVFSENNARRRALYVQNGHAILNSGTIASTNTLPYHKTNSPKPYAEGVLVANGKQFTMNGGRIEVSSAYNPYGIEGASGTPTININGGTLETVAETNDSPYGIYAYGTINVAGGTINAIAKASTSAMGVYVIGSSSYQGTANISGGTILARATGSAQAVRCWGSATVTGDYSAETPDNTPKARYYAKMYITGGTITAECTTKTTAYGVLSYGTTEISGGTITATVQKSDQNTAYGVCTLGGTTTIKTGANITANAPTKAYGVYCSGANGDSNRGWPHLGNVNIQGGTITANTTNTTISYGLYVTGATWTINKSNSYSVFNGDYASAGTATVTGGTFYANAKTTDAGGILVDNTVTKNAASATPVCTVNGGYYLATGTGTLNGCAGTALPANFQINGGYYSHDGNLATYAVTPKQVVTLPKTDANYDPYYYKVSEAYTVTFMNGTEQLQSGYQQVGTTPVYEGATPTKASDTKSYIFDGWSMTDGGSLVNPLPNVTSAGATYYAHFAETTLKYIVTFDAKTNGGNEEAQVSYVTPDAAVGTLPTATKTGYTFNGWFTAASDGTQITTATVPTSDVTYYAQFTVNSHTLTWDLAGGKVSTAGKIGSTTWPAKNATGTPSTSVAYGTILTTIPVVAKTGYTFNRWDPIPGSSMPDNDVTYTALWNPNTNTAYSVKHYQQNVDGTYPTTPTETESLTGTTAASVTPPVKTYDGFVSPATQTATIAADGKMVVEYQYARRHYIFTLDAATNGGTSEVPSIEVIHGATIGAVPPDAQKGCNDFTGWYTKAAGGVKITSSFVIEYDMKKLYAQFSDDIRTWPITYLPGVNGTGSVTAGTKTCGVNTTLSNSTFTRAGYTQTGWSTTDDGAKTHELGGSYTANAALTLYPFWTINQYTISFNSNGGSAVASITQDYNTTVPAPADPTKTGYTFNGWSPAVPSTMPAEDMECVAQWTINQYTISFNSNGGSDVASITQDYNTSVTAPADPTKTGYTFAGWDPAVPGTMPANDTECVAQWTINSHNLAWNWDGGETSSTTHTAAGSVAFGTTISYPAASTMTKANYVFSGWSTDAATMPDADLAITAQWTPAVASVTVSGATTYYTTLQAAFNYAADKTEPTITVLDDINLAATKVTYTNTSKTTVTFDLNGHTISGGAHQLIYLTSATNSGGEIVIKSSVAGGQIRNVLSNTSARYCVYLYKGKLKLESGTIYNENTSTGGSFAVYNASRTFTMEGGQLEAKGKTSVYGLYSSGTSNVSGGKIVVTETTSGTAAGACVLNGTTTISGTTDVDVDGTSKVYGVLVSNRPSTSGSVYNGTLKVTGGTFTVNASGNTAYGVYSYAGTRAIDKKGNYACAGTATVSGGEFTVTAAGATAYGVFVTGAVSISSAKDADGNAYPEATATSTATITGGKFNVSGTSDVYAVNTSASNTELDIRGGWYNIDTNLSGYVAPTKSCNYWTLPLDDATYHHEVAEAYKVTWDATTNGGSCATAYTIVKKSATIGTLPEASKTGFDFSGWFTVASGGTQITTATTITATKTYYAQFAPQAYSITYKDQGDVAFSGVHGDGYPTIHTYGTATALVNPTKAGYAFEGWYDNADCTGAALTEIGTTAYTTDFTLYAKWTINQYTISFNSDGGSYVASITQDYNSSVSAPANPTKTGYTFNGWSPAVPSTMPAEDMECVAQWTPNTNTPYVVKHYQQNLDGSYPDEPTDTDNETGTTDTEVTPAVKSYTGFTAPSTQTVTISADGSLEVTYNYTRNSYNLTWDANGGELSGSYTSGLVLFGTTITAPTANRANYDFDGWDEEPAATMPAEDKTYTAQWSLSAVTILWKSEDGSETLETDNLVLGAAPSFDGTEPTKATTESYTYTFDGWTTEANGAGTFYAIGELPTVSAAATYYAHFTTTANVASVKVGSTTTYYTTIDDAFEYVNTVSANMTITLLADATAAASLVYQPKSTYTCTLDLNNHTISGTFTKVINVNLKNAVLTITDNSTEKGGKIKTEQSLNGKLYGLFITAGKVNLNAGTIECINTLQYNSSSAKSVAAYGVYVYSSSARYFTMTGGTVKANATYNVFGVYSAGTTKLEGGKIIVSDAVTGLTKTGTGYGVYVAGATTTISKSADISVNTKTVAYGIYVNAGTANATGGVILAKTSSSKTAYGVYAYAGTFNAPEGSTTSVTANAYTTTASAIVTGASGTANIYDGTYVAKAPTSTGTTTYGVYSSGTTNIHGGTFTVSAKTSTARAIGVWRNTTTVDGNPVFNVSAPTIVYGATASGTTPKASTAGYCGTLKVYGGTFNIEATKTTTAYGVYAYPTSGYSQTTTGGTIEQGNYINAGTVEVHGGTFNVKAKTTDAYGVFVNNGTQTNAEAGDPKTAYGKCTITDGQFKVETTGDANATAYAMNTVATEENLTVQGGQYSTKRTNASETSNIEDKYTAPTKSCNYHVLDLSESELPYKYEVAEAYNLTWNLDGGKVTVAGSGAALDETGTLSTLWAVGDAITAPTVTKTDYTFNGWTPDVAATMPASDKTYTATWTFAETGDYLDIVDWTASTLTINANGWAASGWPYTINGTSYAKEDRAADRTLTIPYSGAAGTQLQIKVQDKDDKVITLRKYTIPFIGTTTGTNASSIVYVNSGTLIIDGDKTLAALYVRPEASVEVTKGTLTVGKLVMRTLPWQAAAISGNFTATETYYTRIAPNKRTISGPGGEITYESARYYQFALPLNCTVPLSEIHVSHGANTPYGNTWLLKYYSEESRSTNGASGDNWVAVAMEEKEKETYHIQGGVGYEMSSNSNYYREFYFPVGAVNSESLGTKTTVSYHESPKGANHAGWNIICSPLMGTYENKFEDIETALKISELQTDGSYLQYAPDEIPAAIPFSYQAGKNGVLDFSGTELTEALSAPRRRMSATEEFVRLQWLRLFVKDDEGHGDETSILSHPTRYEEAYKTGIDVAKQSFTASRALIYSSHAYGEMAFAGVADSLLEKGVALTIYSPSAQSLTISMRENNWLNRMEYVWLIDTETGIRTDLLTDEYSFYATEGTTAGRFFIEGVFVPKVATDLQNDGMMNDESRMARKLLIDDKIYIDVNGRRYDATGKLVNDK